LTHAIQTPQEICRVEADIQSKDLVPNQMVNQMKFVHLESRIKCCGYLGCWECIFVPNRGTSGQRNETTVGGILSRMVPFVGHPPVSLLF